MITINGLIHRDEMTEIIRRWMYDEPLQSDAMHIFRSVHFNNTFISRYLNHFSIALFSKLYPNSFETQKSSTKGDLKDLIVADPPYRNPRIDELIQHYKENPGNYYRETPFHGTLIFTNSGNSRRYVGSYRIKRVRRLAEKGAQRIIDHIFATIKQHANRLADERASKIGVTRDYLFTQPEEMKHEFILAEEQLLTDLRMKHPILGTEKLVINDVAGLKAILEEKEEKRLFDILKTMPECTIIEKEKHSGRYNATNVIVEYRPPINLLTRQPLNERLVNLMLSHGYSEDQIHQDFKEFVNSSEQKVSIEIILSNYQEMLESEIGCCMHEERIINQRFNRQYWSHVSINIEFLLEYLFAQTMAPYPTDTHLPVKIWNYYLPDYFDEIRRTRFHLPT